MDNIRAPMRSGQRLIDRMPAIICTDIGHDPDDSLALILAVAALPLRERHRQHGQGTLERGREPAQLVVWDR